MQADKPIVMLVDRDEFNLELLNGMLEDDFQVISLQDETKVIQESERIHPDLILIDTGVPEEQGFEICDLIKHNPKTESCSFMFLSEDTSLDRKMAGYAAGCDDYILKPFDPEELLTRLKRQITLQEEQNQLESTAKTAMDAAFAAMQSSSEIGAIVRFLENTLTLSTFDQLATSLLEITHEFGLMCALQIRGQEGRLNFGCDNKSVEAKMLSELISKGKIIDFGARTLLNFPHISLLVRNMPLQEPDNYGRLKDNLVLLTNSCEEKVKTINHEIDLQQQRDGGIAKIISGCHDDLTAASKQIKFLDNLIGEVMTWQRQELEDKLICLGLSEEQEDALLEMVDTSVKKLEVSRNIGEELDQHFATIIQKLTELMDMS
ncbi:MAG: hypothetical protein COB04_10435 [Gammaproteobacteria bacterium]|nr:MAG: hypothetical protein COB04_10435 [Gammaproteobacteria bacterium]